MLYGECAFVSWSIPAEYPLPRRACIEDAFVHPPRRGDGLPFNPRTEGSDLRAPSPWVGYPEGRSPFEKLESEQVEVRWNYIAQQNDPSFPVVDETRVVSQSMNWSACEGSACLPD